MSFLGAMLGGFGSGASSAPAPVAMERSPQTSGVSDPDRWLVDLFGGMLTSTGIRVDHRLAMSVPGIAACVNVMAEDLSKVPLVLFKRTRTGSARATEHPLYNMLKYAPSPWLSSYAWRRSKFGAMITRGNAYSRVFENSLGEIESIHTIKPGNVHTKFAKNGEPFHDVTQGGVRTTLNFQQVLHWAYRPDAEAGDNGGVLGVSPIARHAETIALAVAAERFAGAFFKNGARPSMAIEMEGKFPSDGVGARVRNSLERAYSGMDNAFKIAVLELGMKIKEISSTNSDSQLVEVRKEAAVSMCQILGVPPHKVGILDRATFSNIESQAIDYVVGPLTALASQAEQAMNICFFTPAEREKYYIKFDFNALLRGDIKSRYASYAVGRQWGWLSADDVREFEDMNPLPKKQGRMYLVPGNMTKPEDVGKQLDDASKPTNPDDAEEDEE